jgi:hypothetical protein
MASRLAVRMTCSRPLKASVPCSIEDELMEEIRGSRAGVAAVSPFAGACGGAALRK